MQSVSRRSFKFLASANLEASLLKLTHQIDATSLRLAVRVLRLKPDLHKVATANMKFAF